MSGNASSRLGAKLGPRIAMLVVQAIVYANSRLHSVKHKLAMHIFHAISDEISEEVDVTLGPFLKMLHDNTPEDHPAYPGIHFMHTAAGQLKALSGTGLQISGLLGSISTIMNNELAPIVYGLVSTNPHLLPDATVTMQMAAAGIIDPGLALSATASQGINESWGLSMFELAKSYPALGEATELLRRGLIDKATFTLWAARGGIPVEAIALLENLVTVPVSVADAALAVLRGNIPQAEGEAIAKENGYSAASFAILIGNTGEPPGLMQMLEAYRRGFIDKQTLENGIRESRYRNEWIPMLEALRYEPMSVADAVNATVQNQLDANTARKYADENGLQPGDFDILLNTAGEPLSRTELEELYNRGIVTHDQVIQGLRESRLKNKYNELAFALHEKVLPVYTLQRSLRYGGIDQADAVGIAMESGYSKADATTIVTSGSAEKTQAFRDKVVSSITAMYEDSLMPEADALAMIEGLGYTAEESKLIIKGSEFRRQAHVVNTVVHAVQSKYVGHHITATEASGFLDALGVPAQQRDQLLALWKVQEQAYTKTLTEAQIIKAYKTSLITEADATARLEGLGYNKTDAALLLAGA